ncbi:LAME_0G19702g1_1 [Lachancea meyersii CBS 8951]|uniref:LAME_0G19702g1_1 n=1 Tax=Lachancea meyersii CBS 8951 TaxID=1266667 RepID=A0A1G4KCA6_9SACH|nr:LAME_0G19702g1_1 [Lachancea meyersii CBS 8951]
MPANSTQFKGPAESPTLPRLPVPALDDSLRRYLDRLGPLQDPETHLQTRAAVLGDQNVSSLSELHQELIAYDQELQSENPNSSYIEQFWYDAYLQFDESVVLNVNPYFELRDDPTLGHLSSSGPYGEISRLVRRSANLILSTISFVKEIRSRTLKPDCVRGKSLSMDQYEVLFGSARIPPDAAGHSCQLRTSVNSTHIIVMCHFNFYWFDVLDAQHNALFTPQELERVLYAIVKDTESSNEGPEPNYPWGVFTTENRSVWSNIRDYMVRNPVSANKKNLQIIDSALFVLCLDNVQVDKPVDLVQEMLCGTSNVDLDQSQGNLEFGFGSPTGIQRGTCLNRWYDKLQLIVTRNGKAGINFEHTGVDGYTVLRLATHIYTESILLFAHSITRRHSDLLALPSSNEGANYVRVPRRLEWKVDSYLLSSLHFAETRLSDLISQFEFARLDFSGYGSHKIKALFKVSPDAFVQMALQAAFHALYGKFEVTYEPAMTKGFQNGRTEAIRTVSEQSKRFVEALNRGTASEAQLKTYLKGACDKHSSVTRECAAGMGQDRHLYALYCIWKERFQDRMPKPTIFEDGGWSLLNTSVISTSNCGNPSLQAFGFGPVCANGFGIGYIIRDKTITVVVSSKHRQTERLVGLLGQFFRDMDAIYTG